MAGPSGTPRCWIGWGVCRKPTSRRASNTTPNLRGRAGISMSRAENKLEAMYCHKKVVTSLSSKHRQGGLEALDALVSKLPTEFPAAIFIVQHMAPQNPGVALLSRLGKHKAF